MWRASGWAEGNTLGWIWNNVKHEGPCASAVVEYPGRWPLWVLYDATWTRAGDVGLGRTDRRRGRWRKSDLSDPALAGLPGVCGAELWEEARRSVEQSDEDFVSRGRLPSRQ
jgi:hypothetical protein